MKDYYIAGCDYTRPSFGALLNFMMFSDITKKPMVLVNLALILLILNAFGNVIYAHLLGVEIKMYLLFTCMSLLMFLLAMAHMEKNWARFLVGIMAGVGAIGMLAALILHFIHTKLGF